MLVGGASNVESDMAALFRLGQDWQSSASYNDRISNLQTALGTSSSDDSGRDRMTGEQGQDFFFSSGAEDTISDQEPNEVAIGRDLIALNDTFSIDPLQTLTTTTANSLPQQTTRIRPARY